MNATVTSIHRYVTPAEGTKCAECGKARNTAAHGYSKKAAAAPAAAPQTPKETPVTETPDSSPQAAAQDAAPEPEGGVVQVPAGQGEAVGDALVAAQAAQDAAPAAATAERPQPPRRSTALQVGDSTGFADSAGATINVGDRIAVAAKGNNVRAKDVGQQGIVTGASRTRVKVTWDATTDAPWKAILPVLVTRVP